MIGGVATAVKAINSSVRVVAVEPEGCASLFESFKQNKPSSVECDTICDGVAVPYMTDEVFTVLRDIVDDVVLVSEENVKKTVRRLALGNRMVVEPAGALSVAAALSIPASDRGRCVCILSGGSIDTDKLLGILTGGG